MTSTRAWQDQGGAPHDGKGTAAHEHSRPYANTEPATSFLAPSADSRTADLGTYDNDVLASLLDDLPDLDGTGYTDDDLTELLNASTAEPDALTDVDDVPDPDPDPPITQPGDIWHLAPATFALLNSLLPALSLLVGLVMLRQVPTWGETLGLIFISAAVAIATFPGHLPHAGARKDK